MSLFAGLDVSLEQTRICIVDSAIQALHRLMRSLPRSSSQFREPRDRCESSMIVCTACSLRWLSTIPSADV